MTLLLMFCFVGISVVVADSMEDIPFETAKVIYHKQRICIFRPTQPKCFGSQKIPGDPHDIAHLYKVQKKFQDEIKSLDPIKEYESAENL